MIRNGGIVVSTLKNSLRNMKGLAKLGIVVLFLVAVVIMMSQFSATALYGVQGGNWTNVTITNQTDRQNITNPWWFTNWTLDETDIEGCWVELGNHTGYQNLSCTTHSTFCECNMTHLQDTHASSWYNYTLFVYNTSHDMAQSPTFYFRVDTATPTISVVDMIRKNNTYSLTHNGTSWVKTYGLEVLQDYINISWTYTDNSSKSSDNCEVEIIRETVSSTGALTETSYRNWSVSHNLTNRNLITSPTRRFDAMIPASYITDGVYQGLFFLRPHCTDAVDKIGYAGKNYWGVVNPIPTYTWTPLGHIGSTTTLADWINYSSEGGNISYVAVYPSNASGWITHQYNTASNAGALIDTANLSALYAYTTTGWTTLRLNGSDFLATISTNVSYNDTNGIAYGNWRPYTNLRSNTTMYVINSTEGKYSLHTSINVTCGEAFDWIAWFNSSDTRCAGGCWTTYNNGWGINNETLVPFGTVVWYLTNTSHILMTPTQRTTAGAGGTCEFGSAP